MPTKLKSICYLDQNRIDFYQSGMQSVHSIPLPATVTQNMEIINQDELQKTIAGFVETNKIVPAAVVCVIATGMIFEKNIETVPPQTPEAEITAFLDIVPFNSVTSKTIPLEKGIKIIAVNTDFLIAIKNVFEKAGLLIEMFITNIEINPQAYTVQALDIQEAIRLINIFDKLKPLGLVLQEKPALPGITIKTEVQNKNKPSKLFPVFVIILFISVGVLLFLIFKK